MLSLSFVTGTEPGKWFDRYRDRTNHGGLHEDPSDDPFSQPTQLKLMRLPDARVDPERFHIVRLYEEASGIAVPVDHTLTLVDEISEDDVAEEKILYRYEGGEVDIQAVRDNLQVVAANVGVVIAPRPLLKVLAGKKIETRNFRSTTTGVPATTIALVWEKDADSEAIQDFVGIAKGRTLNSSRQAGGETAKSSKKSTAQSKPSAKARGSATRKHGAQANQRAHGRGSSKQGRGGRRRR